MSSDSQATKQYVLDFKAQSRLDAEALMNKELEKLLSTAHPDLKNKHEKEFEGFRELFSRYLDEAKTSVKWENIQPPPKGLIEEYAGIQHKELSGVKDILDRLVVIKLNGGLGTSMGCTGAKSLISVRSDLTFLDMTIQQIEHLNQTYGVSVPLVLMNSFNTDEETHKTIRKYKNINVAIHCFNQSRHPRIVKESLTPLPKNMTGHDKEWWYPPGHGDVYEAFNNSGLLDKFVEEGRDIAFVSNIDNLGSTVDLHILDHIARPPEGKPIEFIMEVTDKTRADVKGGTLINYEDKLTLLEIAQVPDEHVDDFKAVTKFKIFNTNNLWINLPAVKRLLKAKQLKKEIIVNNKTLQGGLKVIQLETAVGAAIKNFQGAKGINVPRSRFLPVKKTSDLLIVMSNLYAMNKGSLIMSDLRQFRTVPIVQLSGPFFKNVRDFLSRFASIPDLLELDHLTVSGDVTFGRNVSLKGTVIIIANHGERIDIPSGSVLENKIVSGNLRILDH